ncbi:DNA-binding response OmpR family regulator [Variovorax sp. GrIS 2.14]|uniref:helix-turn-helix domain-containing protein n=1 Tax=Variovorax sp. GrIS 2.14 TaxID=3071709 RepID=UPI0038F708AB
MTMKSVEPYVARLLVVDDSPEQLRLLLEVLRGARFEIIVAFDGMQGYGRAVAQAPDLILMDVRMDRTDGFAACRLLKADPLTAHIPVIFLTSSGSLEERLTGLREGAVDYVLKPFEPAEVLARIRTHLRPALPSPSVAERAGTAGVAGVVGVTGVTEASTAVAADTDQQPDHVLVQAALRQVESNLASMPTLAEIARRVGTHEKRLTKAFRQQTGMSVFEFVREQRLGLARRLLTQTPLGIADIAAEAGFSSAANFATAFKAGLGTSPSEYRAQLASRQRPS